MQRMCLTVFVFVPLVVLAAGCVGGGDEIWEVDHYEVACTGEHMQPCLRVRGPDDDNFQLHYSGIQGFSHNWGYRYELEVSISTNMGGIVGAGNSMRSYELVEIISKTEMEPGDEFTISYSPSPPGEPEPISVDDDEPKGEFYVGPGFRCDDEAVCDEIRDLVDDDAQFSVTFAYDDDISGPVIARQVEE